MKAFSLKSRIRKECPPLPLLFNIVLVILATAIRKAKNKIHPTRKGRSKTIIICSEEVNLSLWHDTICYCSINKLCLTLWDPMDCSTPGFPVLHYLLEFAQTHVHWIHEPSNHLILCHPLCLLPSIFPGIMVFSNESGLCIRWQNILKVSTKILLVLSVKLHDTKLIYRNLLLFYTLIMNYQKEKGNNLI